MAPGIDRHARRTSTLMVVVVVFLAVLPQAYRVYHERGLCDQTDEGNQVLAARHWAEHGEYAQLQNVPDLAGKPVYVPVTRWPPGYSAVIAILLAAGVPDMWAVLLVRLVLLIVAAAGWFLVGRRILGNGILAAIVLLPATFRLSLSSADLLVCALSPFIILALLRFALADRWRSRAVIVLGLACALAVIVVMKYSALYFVPAALICVGMDLYRRGRVRTLVVSISFGLALLAAGTVWIGSQSADEVDHVWKVDLERISAEDAGRVAVQPLYSLLLGTFKVEALVWRAAEYVSDASGTRARPWRDGLTLLLAVGLVAAAVRGVGRIDSVTFRTLAMIVAVLSACAGGFLIAVDLALSEVGYAAVFRYYAPIAPGLIFIFARLVWEGLRMQDRSANLAAAAMALVFVPLCVYTVREMVTIVTAPPYDYADGKRFIETATASLSEEEPAVIMGHVATFCTLDVPVTNLEHDYEPFWDEATASRPVWLFLLDNKTRAISGRYSQSVDELSAQLNLNRLVRGQWEIRYRRLEAGPIRPAESLPSNGPP